MSIQKGDERRLITKIHENKELTATIKEQKATIKQQDDIINAQTSHINEIETRLKKYEERGGLVITENDGYITEVVSIPPYNDILPYQDIPCINKTLYRKFPFLKRNGNTITIDNEQYRKYKGVI